jgi:hypothetical protein
MVPLRRLLITSIIIAGLYITLDAIVVFGLNPIQSIFLPDITTYSSLIFLPFSLRIFSTSLVGADAIPGLFLGMVFSSYFFWGVADISLLLVISLFGSVNTWVVFRTLSHLGINAFYTTAEKNMPQLNTYLIVGLVTAMVDGFLMTALLETEARIQNVTIHYASFTIGGLAGLVVGWLLARLLLPVLNRFSAIWTNDRQK